jgi:hypothetical protein
MEMEINVNKMDRFKGKNKILNYEKNYCKIYKEIKMKILLLMMIKNFPQIEVIY